MGPEQEWRAALGQGELRVQRARRSGRCFFPPRVAEPGTGDLDWDWIVVSGDGTVYSVTVIYPRPPAEPYNVVLVDLVEGVRMMGRVVGAEAVEIGMQVRARIDHEGPEPLILFEPA
jgi:uncharacterized OB-fold protein